MELNPSEARTALGATQAEMAQAMGLPLRTYQDIEAGKVKLRPIHLRALAWATMTMALGTGRIDAVPPAIADTVLRLADKLRG